MPRSLPYLVSPLGPPGVSGLAFGRTPVSGISTAPDVVLVADGTWQSGCKRPAMCPSELGHMKKLITSLALVALLTPAAAGAKAKSAPVYRIYGGYDLTSTIYTKCVPVGGGTNLEETTTVV